MAESDLPRLTRTTDDLNGVADKVVELICLGKSMTWIAKTLGMSYLRVRRIFDREFKERFALRDELKQKTALELDWLMEPLKRKYIEDASKGLPNRHDAETILRIIDRRCRLFALDDPVRLDVKHTIEDLSDEQLAKELAVHGVEYRQLPPAVPSPPPIPEVIADAEYVEASPIADESEAHLED